MAPYASLPHGIFIGAHALGEGRLTRAQLGLYRRLLHGVYADPGLPVTHENVARAAALLMPRGAALGGRSAACWWGAPFARPFDPVLVLLAPDAAWRGPRGVRVHRTELPVASTVVVEDIRITDPVRTAWDVAALEPIADAVACLDGMVRAGTLQTHEVSRLLASATGRWRGRRATRALALVDGRAASPPESWVRVACHRAGLPAPVPQFVVEADGVWLAEVDLAWPEQRLIVEYEGEYHFDELQIRKDDRRYARMVAAGWRVIRLSSADLRDLDGVIVRIRQALDVQATAS